MIHRTLTAALSLLLAATALAAPQSKKDRFIDNLLSRMTIDEKIGQLNQVAAPGDIVTGKEQTTDVARQIRAGEIGSILNLTGAERIGNLQRIAVEETRLGIPIIFGLDVIHGYKTGFPTPLAVSASWDLPAIEQSARIAATEASADGIAWTFSPMVDISHDARWGRVAEGSGEDPWLGSQIARAMVRGYQGTKGKDMLTRPDQIAACVKHFALYGASDGGLDYNNVDMSRQRMYNEYFAPYQAAVEEGALTVMPAFTVVEEIPASANEWLLTDVLRRQWGFDGFTVSDYTAIKELIPHGMGNLQEVSARALKAGMDMDMMSHGFIGTLKESLAKGDVTEADIDQAVRRILGVKYDLGLFDNPYKYTDTKRAKTDLYTPEHLKAARDMAASTFVLLKNDGNLLPLQRRGKIALVGPLADTRANLAGTWAVSALYDSIPTLREGLAEVAGPDVEIIYAKGSNLYDDAKIEANGTMFGRELGRDTRTSDEMLLEALRAAAEADVIVAALGEASEMSGESASRTDIGIPDAQRRLLEALVATGKPVVLTLFNGRPMTLPWEQENVPAILDVWHGGSQAALAIGDVLFGDKAPQGRLTMTFPRSVGQLPMQYNHKNSGRPTTDKEWFDKFTVNYIDQKASPLYPFGYGLTYTTFDYSPVRLSATEMPLEGGTVTASVDVTNTGTRPGTETVQLYLRDLVGSSSRPVRELKGFEKVSLQPGEKTTVTFPIDTEMLRFYNHALEYVAEPGQFDVFIGPDSSTDNKATFTAVK